MFKPTLLRRILLAPPTVRISLIPFHALQFSKPIIPRHYATASNIAQTSFWLSLIPKPLRKISPKSALKKNVISKEWNPATFYIVIFLLIGSMSIQMIALRNEFAAFSRRANAKIGLLKEIIERIQKGENVDVEGLLGTGDKNREKEWEDVLLEIEREDQEWEQSRKSKQEQGQALESSEIHKQTQGLEGKAAPKILENKEAEERKPPIGFY